MFEKNQPLTALAGAADWVAGLVIRACRGETPPSSLCETGSGHLKAPLGHFIASFHSANVNSSGVPMAFTSQAKVALEPAAPPTSLVTMIAALPFSPLPVRRLK